MCVCNIYTCIFIESNNTYKKLVEHSDKVVYQLVFQQGRECEKYAQLNLCIHVAYF